MFKLNEGGRWLIGASDTLEGARREVLGFAELWPDEYAILNQDTGEWNSPTPALTVTRSFETEAVYLEDRMWHICLQIKRLFWNASGIVTGLSVV